MADDSTNRGMNEMNDDRREHASQDETVGQDSETMARAGSKGGHASGGNFANDRERASEAGRKGGENSHGGR